MQNLLFFNFRPVRCTAAGIRAGFSSHLVGVSLTSTPVTDICFLNKKKLQFLDRSFLFFTGDNRSRLKLQNLLFFNFRPVRCTAAGIRAGFSSHLVGVSLTSTPVTDICFLNKKKLQFLDRSFLFFTGDNRSRLKLQNLLFFNFRPVRCTAAGIRAGFSSHLVGVSLTSTPVTDICFF